MAASKDTFLIKYFFESRAELGKVVWPNRQQIVQHSLLVIGLSFGLGLYFGLVDYVLARGLEALLTLTR